MNILLVGSTSVVGSAISDRIRPFANVKRAGRVDADYVLDLSCPASLPRIEDRFDLVISAAADFGGPSHADLARAETVNSVGALSVCALAEQTGAKQVLLISSVSASFQPGDPNHGIYSISKRHGEELAAYFCTDKGIALTILRPSQIYDAEGKCRRHQRVPYEFADRAQAGEDILLQGNHDARRNFLFLEDFAEVCSRVIQREIEGVFTVKHPRDVKLSEIASAAFRAFGRGGEVRFLPDRPDIPDLPHLGSSEIYGLIGYEPAVDMAEGMAAIRRQREGLD